MGEIWTIFYQCLIPSIGRNLNYFLPVPNPMPSSNGWDVNYFLQCLTPSPHYFLPVPNPISPTFCMGLSKCEMAPLRIRAEFKLYFFQIFCWIKKAATQLNNHRWAQYPLHHYCHYTIGYSTLIMYAFITHCISDKLWRPSPSSKSAREIYSKSGKCNIQ